MSVPANHGCWHEIAGDDRHCPCARPRNAYTVGYKAHIKAAHLFSILRECPNCEVRLMNNELFYIFQHSKFMGTRKKKHPLMATGARTFVHFVAPSLQRPTINGLWSTSNNKHNFSYQTWSFANIKTALCA